jgi:hypothetical protein
MNERNTTCAHVIELLPLYVGEDLDAEAASGVSAHLAGCAGCRAAAGRASAARARLRAALEETVRGGGPNLWPGVRAGLVREGLLGPRRAGRLRSPWRRAALVAAAAGLAALSVPALLLRGGPEATPQLVQELPAPGETSVEAGIEALALSEPAPAAPAAAMGLVPIRDVRDRLSTQLEPADPRYELTSSPVR